MENNSFKILNLPDTPSETPNVMAGGGVSALDERGITLPTIIITAVLALAAVAVGILLYNLIADETEDVNEAANATSELRATEQDSVIFGEGGRQDDRIDPDDSSNADDPEEELVPGTTESEIVYLAAGLCPKLRYHHWTQYTGGGFHDRRLRSDWIPGESAMVDLSPISSPVSTGCSWESPKRKPRGPTTSTSGAVSENDRSKETGLASELFFSYCALKGGSLMSSRISQGMILPQAVCFYPGPCTASTVSSLAGSPDGSECRLTENIVPPSGGDPDCDSNAQAVGAKCYRLLRAPSGEQQLAAQGFGCPGWQISGSIVPPERSASTYTESASGAILTCKYPTGANCAANGLVESTTPTSPSFCEFSVSITGDYPSTGGCGAGIFKIDSESNPVCILPAGQVLREWHKACSAWNAVGRSDVSAYYDGEYHCVITSENLPAADCENFGYEVVSGKCEIRASSSYDSVPGTPLCPALRAHPYTSNSFSAMIPLYHPDVPGGFREPRPGAVLLGDAGGTTPNLELQWEGLFEVSLRGQTAPHSPPINIPSKFPTANIGITIQASLTAGDPLIRSGDFTRLNTLQAPDVSTGKCGFKSTGLTSGYNIFFHKSEIIRVADNDFAAVTAPVSTYQCADSSRDIASSETNEASNENANFWVPRHYTSPSLAKYDSSIVRLDGVEIRNDCHFQEDGTIALGSSTDTAAVQNGEYAKDCIDYGLNPGAFNSGLKFTPDSPYRESLTDTYLVYDRDATSRQDVSDHFAEFPESGPGPGMFVEGFGMFFPVTSLPTFFRDYPGGAGGKNSINSGIFDKLALDTPLSPSNPRLVFRGSNQLHDTQYYPSYVKQSEGSLNIAQRLLSPIQFEKYGEVECVLQVPRTVSPTEGAGVISEENINWLKACRNLEVLFPTRFSYHKALTWTGFTGPNANYPRDAFYGSTGDYTNPIYFDRTTSAANGHFYCEAHPMAGAKPGSSSDRAAPCSDLNDAIQPYLNAKGITRTTSTPAAFVGLTHQHGFVRYAEGPSDFYTCKWKAPAIGNFLR